MKKELKGFVVGSISTMILTGLVYGTSQIANVYLSPFDVVINGTKYNSEMPVLNYQGRTYLALRELGTALGDEVDFKDNKVIINSNKKISNEITKLDAVHYLIKEGYYGSYSEEKLEEGAIKGLVNALGDKYSVYMNKEEFDSFNQETEGVFIGIGLTLTEDSNQNLIQVVSPIDDSPAYKAGIKPGDYILEIDGVKYTGAELNKATKYIKSGEIGTYINMKIKRGESTLELKVKRENIELYKVEHKMLEENIGYIQIKAFEKNTFKEFSEAYFDLVNNKAKGIVIDLRNNPGGLLNEVINICDILIPNGSDIITTVNSNGGERRYYSDIDCIGLPLVVLVNDGSASASEIMASCLQDNKMATIVGETTFGKGVVQSVVEMVDGTGLKLTIAEYFTPNRNKINGIGVIPDYEIKNSEDSEKDIQLEKAIELLK